ncbi:MAG: tRNA (guanosine(37)-N1)-methyltransferase TrmD [Planctomycetota bacterium]|jgi:tRNA (guanine37-N1)-methyltransferase|nr:tRNA (guanosine(37)-N1)-methyltransferase TrmD [Planctomycetaceae bacterium]MCK4685749.1 tRNA (guanosine(37)-N1)-methyltransferase TrmD [Pirellulales bacterium]MEC7710147.1 tRNA (guanosine(37)-N1)-methyltransferase TrmD [Planctomycetota bacterium]MEC8737263.1 tRNA (guanosine(37)-N1)-methyltransferase TrmD [Planctomycetota bacterium]MEE2797524.1 tRNA (guanosine(37)-N1)-methyltransferase TrmD [Planctomycetota bacterium]|tara:strand:- start:2912 stop:3634 length:723 start_codon:yes stop_codon:yes gene_type:complete
MRIDVVTLFPEMFQGFLDGSLLGAAQKSGLLDIRLKNIRDFATGVHRQVDDRPYGGGPGMLLMPGPVVDCVESLFDQNSSSELPESSSSPDLSSSITMLSPAGRPLTQEVVEELAGRQRLILLCGRYEGFDQRICDTLKPDLISVGNYVLSGGEVAAMVIIDAVARLIPGVLGDSRSAVDDSFSGTERLIEGPQYTRPREYRGLRVPDVLLTGDHQRIAAWRKTQAVHATRTQSNKHTEK